MFTEYDLLMVGHLPQLTQLELAFWSTACSMHHYISEQWDVIRIAYFLELQLKDAVYV